MADLDQGGANNVYYRVALGPTLGWSDLSSRPGIEFTIPPGLSKAIATHISYMLGLLNDRLLNP